MALRVSATILSAILAFGGGCTLEKDKDEDEEGEIDEMDEPSCSDGDECLWSCIYDKTGATQKLLIDKAEVSPKDCLRGTSLSTLVLKVSVTIATAGVAFCGEVAGVLATLLAGQQLGCDVWQYVYDFGSSPVNCLPWQDDGSPGGHAYAIKYNGVYVDLEDNIGEVGFDGANCRCRVGVGESGGLDCSDPEIVNETVPISGCFQATTQSGCVAEFNRLALEGCEDWCEMRYGVNLCGWMYLSGNSCTPPDFKTASDPYEDGPTFYECANTQYDAESCPNWPSSSPPGGY